MGIIGTFEGSASSTLILKNKGKSTGYNGWNTNVTKTNSWGTGSTKYGVRIDNQYISISVNSGQNAHILGRFSEQIVLTPYKTLHVLITTIYSYNVPNYVRFGVGSPSMTGNSFSSYIDCAASAMEVWYSVNVSSLSGNYCIFGFMESNGGGSKFSCEGTLYTVQAYLD